MARAEDGILLIDDHPAIRHSIALLLRAELGLEVFGEAGDRVEALAALERGTPSMAILDISLGEDKASGFALIPELRSRMGSRPILVLSMHDSRIYAERARNCGADGYVTKRAPVPELCEAIRATLSGRLHFPGWPDLERPEALPATRDILSPREFEVLRLLGQGMPARDIAKTLFLSVKTVESHKLSMRRKLGLSGMADLTRFAIDLAARLG